jgi:hypothetical protein
VEEVEAVGDGGEFEAVGDGGESKCNLGASPRQRPTKEMAVRLWERGRESLREEGGKVGPVS